MSENLQQENTMQNFPDELDAKVENEVESEKCGEVLKKLNTYRRFITDLINRVDFQENHACLDDVPISSTLEEANAQIHDDLNVARDCLDNRKEIENHAIDLLLEGMM